ncbi:ABC-2 family transporter protein [bacterium BMS3Bbin10]|nr:ABC-2 family transporter protein [bacterium BMS3Bbin10]
MRALATIAMKEFRDGLRNRWVTAAVLLLAGLALAVTFLGSAPVGTVKATRLAITVVSLASLSGYIVPLIALMLSFNAIVGEVERGTMLLLLSYPISRWQVIGGKFLGHLAILAVAVVIGYGAAGLALVLLADTAGEDVAALLGLMGSSVLLGAVFLMLGYLVSALSRENATAIGLSVGLWLAIVVLYDIALLGILMADTGQAIGEQAFAWLLIVNPVDAFRVFNLTQFANVEAVAGLTGFGKSAVVAPSLAFAAMASWVVAAGLLALARFQWSET